MTQAYGFELIQQREIPELNTQAKLYRHTKTGAELLSLENADENKVFGITFRTPPPNSTGLPHIMEHSVLCGSRKYPVKEPFVELVKGSLNTFLNAFTYPDKTCYPVASQNLQDFYNIVDVYLDAVFHPRLTPEILEQEGWHYEAESPDDPLTYKGVVFNEMKGAYASPDNLVARYSEQGLFPDTAYGLDSGGDPEIMPDLTHAQFLAFHKTYYHPSNARVFFYGDDNAQERLRILDAYFSEYDRQPVDSALSLQTRRDTPWRIVKPYPVSEEAAEAPKSMVMVNWLLPENTNATLTLALGILSYALVGTPASPLYKALIDSGLGEDVIGEGVDDSIRQLHCSVGLKGVAPDAIDRVEALILDTLESIVANGLDADTIEAAINTVEFQLREQNTGRYPRGLFVMLQAMTTWLHDGDPFAPIAFEAPLQAVKHALAAEPRYFEGLVREHLLANQHRLTVVLEPDPDLQDRQDAAEKARLARAKAALTESELAVVRERARHLKELQEKPDSPEALATIPSLGLEDLDREPKHVPTEAFALHDTQVLYHDLFTNGIVYLDLGLNLHALPQELLPYTELFLSALLEIGTESEDFVKLMQRIGRQTGGISPTTFTAMIHETGSTAAWAFLRSKALVAQVPDLLAILRDVLLTVKLDNKPRFVQMLLERKAREEAGLVPGGHRVAASRLRAKFSESHWVAEQIGGITYLFALRRLVDEASADWPTVLQRLEQVRSLLVNRDTMLCNVTVDAGAWTVIQPQLDAFLGSLPSLGVTRATWTPTYNLAPEALTLPANVNYVSKGANLFDLGYKRHGSAEVISHYLRSTWLWERVRVQGGAYGGFCILDSHSGTYGYVSYRDPNLVQTLDVYDQTAGYLEALDLPQEELVKGIIGAIGAIDAYQLPDSKGFSATVRALIGYTDEARQKYRTELLSTTAQDFKAFATVARRVAESGSVVVVGSPAAIQAADEARSIGFEITKLM